MKVVLTILMITIGVFALVTGAVLAQSGNDLFQQALVKERTEGNLPEAIKLRAASRSSERPTDSAAATLPLARYQRLNAPSSIEPRITS